MKKIVAIVAVLFPFVCQSQNVGIGTNVPALHNNLHVHSQADPDASIGITNSITTDAILKGARFRMLFNDLIIHNYGSAGNIMLAVNSGTALNISPERRVGIGTNTPLARLHVADSSVLFSAMPVLPATPQAPPVQGAGTRMMWYADKAALRYGKVSNTQWDMDSIGKYSFAGGENVKAYGDYSTALGLNNEARGFGSAALGVLSKAYGIESFAIGIGSLANGNYSIAMGEYAATHDNSAIALNGTAYGAYSVALGKFASSYGNFSTAIGNAISAAYASIAMGFGAVSAGDVSMSIGAYTNSRSYLSLALGSLNDSTLTASKTSWVSTDPLIYVGNGNPATGVLSNAMVIYKNANTDISGYTRLGTLAENAPRIKIKEITGTLSPSADGASTIVAHGLNRSKIIAMNVLLVYGTGDVIPGFRGAAGYEYSIAFDDVNIYIYNIAGNSSNIINKPLKISITYKE